MDAKVNSVRAQEEERPIEESYGESLYRLEKTCVIIKRILIEIRTLKAFLVRSQIKMRNRLLETGKVTLGYKVVTNSAELCSSVM